MHFYKKVFIDFLKGTLIGIGVLIPGLSGGTVAVFTRSFEQIIESVANIKKHFMYSVFTLSPLLAGALFSILLLVSPMQYFCDQFPEISKYTFIIISIISVIVFCVSSLQIKPTTGKVFSFILGILIAALIDILTVMINIEHSFKNPFLIMIIGIPLAFALILPGISFSYMLLFFGLYDRTLAAIESKDILFLLFLFIGIIIGSYIFTKLMHKAISRFKQETYSLVLGFLLYSLLGLLFK